MFLRVAAIAQNSFRENVRARLLQGLFALAIATAMYSLIVGAYAFRDTVRVISDVGGASVSLYGIVVAIVLGATALYRELELKTAFPILARPLARWEYLVGKFLGSWITLFAFVFIDTGMLLLAIAAMGGRSAYLVAGWGAAIVIAVLIGAWALPRLRLCVPLMIAVAWTVVGWQLSAGVPDERRVLLFGAVLALLEIGVVIAWASLFSAFSSPFLTAVLTLGVVIVGRSADTLERLPAKVFGSTLSTIAKAIASGVPNLMLYVPPRTLMTGELPGSNMQIYLLHASLMAFGWILLLLVIASVTFARRDFT
jgi:Cu-processing system permease protein